MDATFNHPEFVILVVALPRLPPQMHDVVLLSLYRLAGNVSETPETMSLLSKGGFSKAGQQLSDELAELDTNRMAYELSELHRLIKFQSFCIHAYNSSNTELEGICPDDIFARSKSFMPEWDSDILAVPTTHMDVPLEPLVFAASFLGAVFQGAVDPDSYPWDCPRSAATLSRALTPSESSLLHLSTV